MSGGRNVARPLGICSRLDQSRLAVHSRVSRGCRRMRHTPVADWLMCNKVPRPPKATNTDLISRLSQAITRAATPVCRIALTSDRVVLLVARRTRLRYMRLRHARCAWPNTPCACSCSDGTMCFYRNGAGDRPALSYRRRRSGCTASQPLTSGDALRSPGRSFSTGTSVTWATCVARGAGVDSGVGVRRFLGGRIAAQCRQGKGGGHQNRAFHCTKPHL